jgi:hypothetical protein
MDNFTTSYQMSILLKQFQFPQKSRFYWHKKTRELIAVQDIPKIKEWEKLYISSYTDGELDDFLVNGVNLKRDNMTWKASYNSAKKHKPIVTGAYEISANAKAKLITMLIKEEIIHL